MTETQNDDRDELLRLFVAIEVPSEVRVALAGMIETLREAGVDRGLRWVRPESIHLTLKFLGGTPASNVPAIVAGLRDVAASSAPLTLALGRTSTFGGRAGVRVVWVGVGGDVEALSELAAKVDAALMPLGAAREEHPFHPHLTLARTRERADRSTHDRTQSALRSFLEREPSTSVRFRVDDIALIRSTPIDGGMQHDVLHTFRLGA